MQYVENQLAGRKFIEMSKIATIINDSKVCCERKSVLKQKETLFEKIGRIINMAGTAVLMNLLFLVSCLPIVTIGQAWCALVSAIRYNIRGDSWFEGYKKGFKTRFWRGTISWVIMLAVAAYLMLDLNHAVYQGFYVAEEVVTAYIAPLIGAAIMFALAGMLTVSLLMLNVYIPTKPMDWIRNAVNMIFKYPLQLLVAAALFWLPVLLGVLWFSIFYMVALIFIAVYFTLAALGATMILKEPLVDYLIDARANGTLIAEEGKRTEKTDDDEDEEYEDDEEYEEEDEQPEEE